MAIPEPAEVPKVRAHDLPDDMGMPQPEVCEEPAARPEEAESVMVARGRIELPTPAFSVQCSTD